MVVASTAQLSLFCTLASSMLLKQNPGSLSLDVALTVLLILPNALAVVGEVGDAFEMDASQLALCLCAPTSRRRAMAERVMARIDAFLGTKAAANLETVVKVPGGGSEATGRLSEQITGSPTAALAQQNHLSGLSVVVPNNHTPDAFVGDEELAPPMDALVPASAPSSLSTDRDLSDRVREGLASLVSGRFVAGGGDGVDGSDHVGLQEGKDGHNENAVAARGDGSGSRSVPHGAPQEEAEELELRA